MNDFPIQPSWYVFFGLIFISVYTFVLYQAQRKPLSLHVSKIEFHHIHVTPFHHNFDNKNVTKKNNDEIQIGEKRKLFMCNFHLFHFWRNFLLFYLDRFFVFLYYGDIRHQIQQKIRFLFMKYKKRKEKFIWHNMRHQEKNYFTFHWMEWDWIIKLKNKENCIRWIS